MSKLRDAIAAAYESMCGIDIDTQITYPPDSDDVADAVLAMPEMVALKAWILEVGLDGTDENWPLRRVLGGLPEAFLDWALEADQ